MRAAYDVAPNLRPLGTDFGNGPADARVFLVDDRFRRFRRNRLRCRAERLGKYVATAEYSREVAGAVARFMATRLAEEYPALFECDDGARPGFHSRLTGETLTFDAGWGLLSARSRVRPAYGSAWDALASQVQEDLAVTVVAEDGRDRLAALHVCSPSHWAPEEKIGRGFVAVHAPVPGMAGLFPAAASLVEATIRRGPWVRFVWGVAGDDRLNHHPDPPRGVAAARWRGPVFRPRACPPGWFRVERQVLWGLPEVNASLFVIAPSVRPLDELTAAERAALTGALRSMSPEARAYKGLSEGMEPLLAWLSREDAGPA